MKSIQGSDAAQLTVDEHASALLSQSGAAATPVNRKALYLLERTAYHGFVGLFLATIPLLVAVSWHLLPSSNDGTASLTVWVSVAALYTYLRVKRDLAPKNKRGFFKRWAPFLGGVPNFLIMGCLLGGCMAIAFERAAVSFVIGGGLLAVTLFAWLHSRRLAVVEELIEKNEQEIEKWVSEGDEDERSRRRAYVQSGALMVGAAAAGVAEYEGAPKLEWQAGLRYASYDDDEGDSWNYTNPDVWNTTDSVGHSSMTYFNPATGLPTIDDMPGSIDIGGNSWGHDSFV